jgi:hypothetical protein
MRTHPDTPCLPPFIKKSQTRAAPVCWEKRNFFPHKKTLFHTAAHFRGSRIVGQGISRTESEIFFNKVKDLAQLLEISLKENSLEK